MNAKQYYEHTRRNRQVLLDVLKEADTNMAYFRQLAYGFRKPSVEMAKRLEVASGGEMKAAKLLGL